MMVAALNCCGLAEIHGLSSFNPNAETALKAFIKAITPMGRGRERHQPPKPWRKFGAVLFTEASSPHFAHTYGQTFAAFLLAEGLGAVIEVPSFVNPNTSNTIRTWVWTVDWRALGRWADIHQVRRPGQRKPKG